MTVKPEIVEAVAKNDQTQFFGMPVIIVDWMLPGAFALKSDNGDLTFYSSGHSRVVTAAEQTQIFDAAFNAIFGDEQ